MVVVAKCEGMSAGTGVPASDGVDTSRGASRVDFFVSYTRADEAWAEWIAWQLEDAGYRVLVQMWDFVPGAHWMSLMDDGVRAARHTIAVLSHAYLRSVYGQAEWQAAYRQDPDGFARKIVPVRVEDCPRPGFLGGVVSLDLIDLPSDKARDQLLGNIRSVLDGRAKPDTEPVYPGLVVPPSPRAQKAGVVPVFPGTADLTPVHVLVHQAPLWTAFSVAAPPVSGSNYDGSDAESHYFVKVTNLYPDRDIAITHVWFATEPRVDIVLSRRPLPTRIRPDETWEGWASVARFQTDDAESTARVRLADGKVLGSRLNPFVEPGETGFVAGPGSPYSY